MNLPNIEDNDRSAWQERIRALEDESRLAFLARDLDRLDELWSDHFVVNSPINRILDKREVLDLLQKGVIAHSQLEQHIELIRRNGDLVIVMGSELVTNSPDAFIVRRRFTDIWRQEGSSWRLFARHAHVTSEPSK